MPLCIQCHNFVISLATKICVYSFHSHFTNQYLEQFIQMRLSGCFTFLFSYSLHNVMQNNVTFWMSCFQRLGSFQYQDVVLSTQKIPLMISEYVIIVLFTIVYPSFVRRHFDFETDTGLLWFQSPRDVRTLSTSLCKKNPPFDSWSATYESFDVLVDGGLNILLDKHSRHDVKHFMWRHCNGSKDSRKASYSPRTSSTSVLLHNRKVNPIAPNDDVIKWKHFPRYWPFVWGIHRSPVYSHQKGQWRGTLIFFICASTNGWANNRDADDLRRHRTHCDVTVMGPVDEQETSQREKVLHT